MQKHAARPGGGLREPRAGTGKKKKGGKRLGGRKNSAIFPGKDAARDRKGGRSEIDAFQPQKR